LVGKLERLVRIFKNFETDSNAATYGNFGTGFDGAQFHLNVGSVVRRGANETFKNDTELTIVAHDILLFNTIYRKGCHRVKGEDKPSH
jgi:hypothetical protein